MAILTILLALCLLMYVAYRGFSVIVFAPIAALLAVLLTQPAHVLPFYSGIFMDKVATFVLNYFPVFLLGALFGKLVEMSGFAKSITKAAVRLLGPNRAILAIALVCSILTYGGVSLFVVAFAVYPFAAEMFKAADIPKRLIPGTIALGAFTFTMAALPGSPQIQNIIPSTFFKTNTWAAPWLGVIGSLVVLVPSLVYLEWRRASAKKAGEGYGTGHIQEPEADGEARKLPNAFVAIVPLALVLVLNKVFTAQIPRIYDAKFDFAAAGVKNVAALDVGRFAGLWAVEAALLIGCVYVVIFGFWEIKNGFSKGITTAVSGALLAIMNTASEFGFGGVISSLAGFTAVKSAISGTFQDPLLNAAVSTTTLAGITGSASGGMSIALATMGQSYLEAANQIGIPPEVLHRVCAMASSGLDTLPHNGAVITLFAITGLTHKESYKDIFVITVLLTLLSTFFVVGLHRLFGIV
jgi:H+/gluconate symporter-like permease